METSGWRATITGTLGMAIIAGAMAVAQSQPAQDPPTSLPATNFSGADAGRGALPRAAPGFAHATVASNPQAPDARAIGEKTCIACHKLEADHFTHTLHALGLHVANRSDPTIPVCEACHGPGSAHAANPQMKGLIIGYTKDSGTPIATQTKTCLTCHAKGCRTTAATISSWEVWRNRSTMTPSRHSRRGSARSHPPIACDVAANLPRHYGRLSIHDRKCFFNHRNINMNQIFSRRSLTKAALTAVAFVPLARLSLGTAFADSPALDPGDPTAKALGYVTKSAKPDSKCGIIASGHRGIHHRVSAHEQ